MTFKYPKVKIAYDLLDITKSNLLLFIILFVLNNNPSTFMNVLRYVLVIILTFTLLSRLKEVFFTKVVFAADGVREYTGMFSKSERYIPREKFENIQTSTKFLQRLFRANTVIMETGDATGDVTFNFVKRAELEKIKAYVLSKNEITNVLLEQDDEEAVLFTPTMQDITKASLTSFSFLAIIPIAINVWTDFKLDNYVDVDAEKLPLWLTIVLILLAIIAALGIGLMRTFNNYYQYKISMDGERIYVQKGWLSKQSFSIRKEKVQAVIFKQSFYQKLLRVMTIRLISTGVVMTSDEHQINEFFPYIPVEKADELMATMLPQLTRKEVTHRASKKAGKLIWLRPPIFAIIVALLGLLHWIFYVLGSVVFVLTYVNRILAYKNLAFSLQEEHVQVTSGAFTVETLVTTRAKLIELDFESSILQRKTGVLTVKISNRAQPIHVTELKDIDAELQKELLIWFEQRAKEVRIDPKTKEGALKKDVVVQLIAALKMKLQ